MSRCMLGNKRFDCKEVYDKPYKDTGRQTRHLNDLVLGLLIYREELSETFRGGCGDATFNFSSLHFFSLHSWFQSCASFLNLLMQTMVTQSDQIFKINLQKPSCSQNSFRLPFFLPYIRSHYIQQPSSLTFVFLHYYWSHQNLHSPENKWTDK